MAEEQTNDNVEETPVVETEAAAEAAPEPVPAEEAALEPSVRTEPAEALTPKQRKERARLAKAAKVPVRQTRTPEQRQAERVAQRRRKAQERRTQRERERAKASSGSGPAAATAPREHEPGAQKTRQGIVVSDRADKTITVRIDIARRHRRYEKIVRISRTLHAHDEGNAAHIGDTVIVRESRPLSRSKRWRLIEVVERAK